MTKKAPRGIPPRPQSAAPAFDPENPGAWINPPGGPAETPAAPAASSARAQVAASAEPMKRLTFDIPARLHRRIKAECALKGVEMAVELRRIMSEHFPEDTAPQVR